MLVILIIFSFLLYSRIQTRDLNDEIGVNIFEVFKEKKITCDLRDFVTSADNPEREYNMLIHDLTKHCSTSVTANLAPILCRIILIELEIGCTLPNKTRPTPVKYTHSYTSEQICSMHKIVYTNKWIWEKLTKKERIQIGSSWTQLCPQLTSTNSTLRLTRFFYKMAPRIRHAENLNTAPSVNNTSDHSIVDTIHISRETNSPTNTSIKELDQLSINKSIVQEVIPKKQNKYQSIFDSRKKRLKSSKTQRNLGRRKHYLDKERENLLDFAGEETQVIKKRIALKEPKEQNEALVRLRRTGIRAEFDAGNGNKRNGNNWFKGELDENRPPMNIDTFHRLKYDDRYAKRKKLLSRSRLNRYHDDDDDFDGWTNHFTSYFLIFILSVIIIYFTLQNKNKIIGLIIEGCGRHKHERRTRISARLSQPS